MKENVNYHIITYGDAKYKTHRPQWEKNASSSCFDSFKFYDSDSLLDIFDFKSCTKNDTFLKVSKHKTGSGFWIWKPFIINDYLRKIDNGDLLIYCDLRWQPNPKVKSLQLHELYLKTLKTSHGITIPRYTEDDKFLVDKHLKNPRLITTKNKYFTHSSVFDHFKLNNISSVKDKFQILAGAHCIVKNTNTTGIYEEFQNIAENNPLLFSGRLKKTSNDKDLVACRHDQSVWNLICEKYDISSFDAVSSSEPPSKNTMQIIVEIFNGAIKRSNLSKPI